MTTRKPCLPVYKYTRNTTAPSNGWLSFVSVFIGFSLLVSAIPELFSNITHTYCEASSHFDPLLSVFFHDCKELAANERASSVQECVMSDKSDENKESFEFEVDLSEQNDGDRACECSAFQ